MVRIIIMLAAIVAVKVNAQQWIDVLEKGAELANKVVEKARKSQSSTHDTSSEGDLFRMTDRGDHVVLDYGKFVVNYSCEHRGYNFAYFDTEPDGGNNPRYKPFHKEKRLPASCPSQSSTRSYKKQPGHPQYHRGHGVNQNPWDHRPDVQMSTNYMVNIVPQNGRQNASGLWRKLEQRVECARDKTTVTVVVGNVWGNDVSNDLYKRSHGVTTPDFLYRIHYYHDWDQAFAWMFPNDDKATLRNEAKYRVTLSEIRQAIKDYQLTLPGPWQDGQSNDPYTGIRCGLD